ncbi:MAG: diguanylate cyclase [Gammaproteobacteria bacterium]|nr:diguanylate cyclase [Gammaproteobacteria bacterium]
MTADPVDHAAAKLPSLLLVEDSQITRAILSRDLSQRYTLHDALDGEQAWELLCANPEIELVVTDIQMPRLNGHDLLKRIRTSPDPRINGLPVIVMTGADDTADRNQAFANGANDFLTKPVDILELQARVNVHHKLTRTIRELEQSRVRLAELANTDPLTKLKNRRSFEEHGAHHLAMARRYKTDLSLLLLDIDFFKNINDRHGHQTGDQVLTQVADLLAEQVRVVDIVARIGGEEFAVLLPATNRLGAAVLAERIRATIEEAEFPVNGAGLAVTVSIGMASLGAEPLDSVADLLAIADKRLYLAKNNGRNRICVNDQGKSNFLA